MWRLVLLVSSFFLLSSALCSNGPFLNAPPGANGGGYYPGPTSGTFIIDYVHWELWLLYAWDDRQR
jgi:hypothetical protein